MINGNDRVRVGGWRARMRRGRPVAARHRRREHKNRTCIYICTHIYLRDGLVYYYNIIRKPYTGTDRLNST